MPSEYIDVLDPVADHDLNRGLAAWWLGLDNLSGGTTLYDIKRCPGYDGTLTNGPTWTGLPVGPFYPRTLAFTRAGNSRVATTAVCSTGIFTLSGWFRFTAVGTGAAGNNVLLWFGTAGSNYGGVTVSGSSAINVFGSGSGEPAGTSTGTWPGTNQWVHYTLTRSASVWTSYLNGIATGTTRASGTWGAPTGQLQIAGRADATQSVDGFVWDIRFVNGAALAADLVWDTYDQSRQQYPDLLRRVSSRAWILGVAQDTPTTAVPGTASGQGTCTAPTITQLYTATPGTAAGTSSVVAPTVILVYPATPGTATGQGACDDVTVTHGTLTVTPGTASGTGSCTDVTVTQLFTATPGIANGTGTCTDVTTTFGPLTVTPGAASGTGTCADVSVTFGTLNVTPGTASGQGTCIDVVLSTFEPGIASATSDCVAPSVIQVYTTTPGTADGTGTCTSPTVTFGPVSITPGTALSTGTCTDVTPTFGPLSISPGTASGTGTCVDVTVNSATTATPGTASATGTCTDVTVSEVYYVVPGTATGQGACVDVSVTHGALVVTPGVANAQGQCTKVRVSGPSGPGGGSKLLLMGAS